MGRKILLVTTDQQRYDTLGCNGGTLARTPVVDGLAAEGIRFERAHPQSVVCMPSRSTILTGQHPTTHGVWMNGVPLPVDAPSVAEVLHRAGYRTALVGKAHFEPFLDPFLRFEENALARTGTEPPGGLHRGFEHLEMATHGAIGPLHYARWLTPSHPEAVGGFYPALDGSLQVNAAGGGRHRRPPGQGQPDRPGDLPHRLGGRPDHRLARHPRRRRGLVLLDELPRPPPPLGPARVRGGPDRLAGGPPARRLSRGPGRQREAILDAKPRHWRLWYDGDAGLQLRGAGRLGAGHPHRRPGARGQRPQRRRVRAHRRGPRPGARPRSPSGAGPTTSTWSSPPTTASCRATSACCSRARTTWTPSCACPLVWRPAPSAARSGRRW